MKLVTAVIQPHKLDDVRETLAEIGVKGMTVIEARGFGRQKGHKEVYRGAEYQIDFTPKLQVEIVVSDSLAEPTISAIREAAGTGNIGDGKIFVIPVENSVRIRTGETGDSAL